MATYVSSDGHWRVSTRIMDGRALVRVEYDSPRVPGHGVPVHPNGTKRLGPQKTSAHPWYLVADVPSVEQVAAYVPLSLLEGAISHDNNDDSSCVGVARGMANHARAVNSRG